MGVPGIYIRADVRFVECRVCVPTGSGAKARGATDSMAEVVIAARAGVVIYEVDI